MGTKIKVLGILIIFSVLLVGCNQKIEEKGPLIEDFSFTSQHQDAFGTADLKGKIWVADFIFTNCTTVCPPMTYEMSQLQKRAQEEGIDLEFVSFTVDPAIDSPSDLQTYISTFTDDDSNWHVLSGYSQQTIEDFALKNFRTIVLKPNTSDQVIHSTNFYLVSQNGKVIDEFNYVDPTYADQLFAAAKLFAKKNK